jgi:hypothetical protein
VYHEGNAEEQQIWNVDEEAYERIARKVDAFDVGEHRISTIAAALKMADILESRNKGKRSH